MNWVFDLMSATVQFYSVVSTRVIRVQFVCFFAENILCCSCQCGYLQKMMFLKFMVADVLDVVTLELA